MSNFNMNTHTKLTHARTHSHHHALLSQCSFFSTKYPNHTLWRCLLLFISPPTRAPQSWSVVPSRTTGIFLVLRPWPCLERWTSPCPQSLHTPPCPHAIPLLHHLSISPGTKSAPSPGCEMTCLWRT